MTVCCLRLISCIHVFANRQEGNFAEILWIETIYDIMSLDVKIKRSITTTIEIKLEDHEYICDEYESVFGNEVVVDIINGDDLLTAHIRRIVISELHVSKP